MRERLIIVSSSARSLPPSSNRDTVDTRSLDRPVAPPWVLGLGLGFAVSYARLELELRLSSVTRSRVLVIICYIIILII